MSMEPQGAADRWEPVRHLSDAARNEALLALLARRAPDARVLEIGCGSGVLSCIAAKLGARRVYAVEPTARVGVARALVAANRLQDVVEVLPGQIHDLEPRPVDVAFSDLLHADPFRLGIVRAMDRAARWVVPGGHLLPRRLTVWCALVRENSSALEARDVRRSLVRLADRHDLDLSPLLTAMDALHPYAFVAPRVEAVTAPARVCALSLGRGEAPPERQRISIPIEEPGPIGGAVVWFEVELDDGIVLHNAPGQPGRWGHLVHGWPREVGGRRGGSVDVEVRIDAGRVVVSSATAATGR